MLSLRDVTLWRGAKPIFQNASFTAHPGDKIGLIGANGSGKSSLFALLLGQLHAQQGDVDMPAKWRIAHVAQHTPASERSATDYAIDGDRVLRGLQEALAQAEANDDGHRIAEIHGQLADHDAYTASSRAQSLLLGLGFKKEALTQPVHHFSGGWRMRLNLAQALMCPSDLLLLDEPTNHLDLDAIIWLERWLSTYPGTLIVISHDRDFLDAVVKTVAHIDAQKLVRYSGHYSSFEVQRAERLTLAQSAFEKQKHQIAHLQSFIDRFKAKATKAKQAQSRVKALEKMEKLAPIHAAAAFTFEFREPLAASDPLLTVQEVDAGYPSASEAQPILRGIDFPLPQGKRIGILGVNGAGKSTLVQTLVGSLAPLHGQVRYGKGLSIGYFAQHQVETLRHDDSALQHLIRIAPDAREQELRDFLGSFLFRGDMATSPIAPLSGGEKARLALALIVWQRPNLLILDEPTNHLDLEAREALTYALAHFEGSLLLVSHDRHLLRATTDEFWLVADGQVQTFDGDLEAYTAWILEQRALSAAAQSSAAGTPQRRETRKLEAEARQRAAQRKKPIEKRIAELEKNMAKASAEKQRMDAWLADAESYADAHKDTLKQTMLEHARLIAQLAQWEEAWLTEHDALEAIEASLE